MDPFLYLDRDTPVHRLDPRTKMFILAGAFVLAFLFVNPLYQAVILAGVLVYGYVARSLVNLKRIRFILVMIALVTVVLWTLFGSGETPLFLFVEWESLLYGIGTAMRIDLTIIAGMIFLSTTRNEEMATGLVRLGIPYRFAFAVSTALRLVPTIAATASTIVQAQRSRGLDLESGSFIQRVRKYVPLLVPVFVSTIRSTNTFSMALESKGFGASSSRTYFLRIAVLRRDVLVMVAGAILVVAAVALRLAGFGGIEGFSR
ncbi:energy-coupling factor transporter transmembrane component T family protein [Rubrobacter aplysinae]|uniref:energy-coupling factor transporter transmembrane component T family protein n=1 Tax=Rubrobacter aplysinae TaxID=909625 RepID=UPI00064C3914|nr:energy-coupling factor transporter transmembrane component T [Rubrobacter aplysinae]